MSRTNLGGSGLSYRLHAGFGQFNTRGSDDCITSYHPRTIYPPAFPRRKPDQKKRSRRKLGRKKAHWSKRASRARYRDERYLRRDQVERAFALDAFASEQGNRLDAFISLRWSLTELEEVNIASRWTRFLSALGRWCRQIEIKLAYIWVHENPPKRLPAFNTHMLANIPKDKHKPLRQFMLKHFRAFDKQAVDIRPRTSGSYSHTERLAYILKGADKATAMKHHLFGKDNRWKGSQGLIPFKRVGVRYQRQLSLGFKCFHN